MKWKKKKGTEIVFIMSFFLLAIIVSASPPTSFLSVTPENNTNIGTSNTTLTCSGTTDPDGDDIYITFTDIESIFRSKEKINTSSACPEDEYCPSTDAGFDGDNALYITNATGQIGDATSGGTRNYVCEQGNGVSYFGSSGSDTWTNANDSCSGMGSRWHLAQIDSDDENLTIRNNCKGGTQCWIDGLLSGSSYYISDLGNFTLQNTTTDNFNWTGLDTSGFYNWTCVACDTNAECGNIYNSHFNLAFSNFNLLFQDEVNKFLFSNKNITIEIVGDNYYTNTSTTNSSILVSNVALGDYILRFYHNDSLERDYFTTLGFNQTQGLNLYILNSSTDPLNVTFNVLSGTNEKLEGAIINVNRYYIGTNTFDTVERLSTNFEGAAVGRLVDTEFYRFVIEYDNETRLSTSSTRIFDTILTFIIEIIEDPTGNFKNIQGISSNITYSNSSNNFVLTYTDSNKVSSQFCLDVYQNAFAGDTLLGSSCSSSQSGTIIVGITPTNGSTYDARAYATIDSIKTLINRINIKVPLTSSFDYGNNGVWIVFLLTILFMFIGTFNPVVALLIVPLPLLFSAILGVISIPIGVVLAVYVAFIAVAIFIGRGI